MLTAILLAASLADPRIAVRVAMHEQGLSLDLRDGRRTVLEGLLRICQRESVCIYHPGVSSRIGIHMRDASASRWNWLKMVQAHIRTPRAHTCRGRYPGLTVTSTAG